MKTIHRIWLEKETRRWVTEGMIEPEQATRILDSYPDLREARTPLAIRILTLLGVLLLGGGVLLLFAYNWTDLSRPVRAFISFLPLVAALGWVGRLLMQGRRSTPTMEGAALFWSLSLGACMALISQTYHIGGRPEDLCFTWSLLLVPILYLTRTISPLPLFYGLSLYWATARQLNAADAMGWWLLFAWIVPCLAHEWRRPITARRNFVVWTTSGALFIGLGILLEKCIPGLWIPVYAAWIGVLALADCRRERQADAALDHPCGFSALAGTLVFSFLLSWPWPWDGIGWRYYRGGPGYTEWAGLLDGVLLIGLLAGVVILWAFRRPRSGWRICTALAPVPALLSYLMVSAEWTPLIPALVYNVYLMILGGILLGSGFAQRSASKVNLGMLTLCGLIIIRFVDSEFTILTRAIVFILLGAGILIANRFLIRRSAAA